jgi:hypothetical protein
MDEKIRKYFANLGFDHKKHLDIHGYLASKIGSNRFYSYQVENLTKIYFIYLPASEIVENLFDVHQLIWNDNNTETFIVISDNKTLLCSSKYKPLKISPLDCNLESFNYGINSPGFPPSEVKVLFKESIDCGFFWDFVANKLNERKKQVVDEDLLLNLIQLKRDLGQKENTYILIERCLFLKFLEDKGFLAPETLIDILRNEDSEELISKFNEINKKLNGDIFSENIFKSKDISQKSLNLLYKFFTSDYRRRDQLSLFPYKFDVLPIELLSNIYEAFLKIEKKIQGGIYYTPSVLVDLILNQTLESFLKKNKAASCIDFACGSGIFLVKAFEKLIDENNCHAKFDVKKDILKNCIFGVEKDEVATRITIFSLYLKLLEGEDPVTLRILIKENKIKFPKLFDKNILNKDTLFDDLIFSNEDGKIVNNFDAIVGNPPWGVNPFDDPAINNSSRMNLSEIKQNAVNDYQSSQYFILKAADLMSDHSIAGIVTNNSNFLVNKGQAFRARVLSDYNINLFYDLKDCNSILFRKRKLEDISLGADEPPVVLIFKKKNKSNTNIVKYINPSLDRLSKLLRIINVKSSEISNVTQDVLYDALAWRVLSVGTFDDYSLIKKLKDHKGDTSLKGFYGFQFQSEGPKAWRNVPYIDKDCVTEFIITGTKKISSQGVAIRRHGLDDYKQKKLLIKRYIGSDLRIKAAFDNKGYRFQENLLGLLFNDSYDYRILLALYNSSTISYFLFLNSAQIGKGTYDMLHATEIESAPIPKEEKITPKQKATLVKLVMLILQQGHASKDIFHEIDETVYDIFHLKEFEKQKIRDFFKIKERENSKQDQVNDSDLKDYIEGFKNTFSFILKDDKFVAAKAFRASTLGAAVVFTLEDKKIRNDVVIQPAPDIVNVIKQIKKRQLSTTEKTNLLKQDKIKFYTENSFCIVKSNNFIDWTKSTAIKDANEEVALFIQSLPEK